MNHSYVIGIDIGTSACKAALFDRKGQVKAAATGDYQVYYPKEGWAEQNPEEWWSAVCQAVRSLLHPPSSQKRSQGLVLTARAGLPRH